MQDLIIGGNIGKNTSTSNENADKDYIQVSNIKENILKLALLKLKKQM